MRVLAGITTFNDEKVIDQCLGAVGAQTRPVDGVLIVDNASTDGTLDRPFPATVDVIRHGENLGTSGGAHSAMAFALAQGYDWVWLFDADSAPRPDALERLFEFHDGLAPGERERVHRLTSLAIDVTTGQEFHGMVLTERGFEHVAPPPGVDFYECIGTIWSGSLFRAEAVRAVGLPRVEYRLDWAEFIYGYKAAAKGYRTYVVSRSVIDHNIDRVPTSEIYARHRFGPLSFKVMEFPALRLYYIVRNELIFWLYEYEGGDISRMRALCSSMNWVPKHIVKYLILGRWAQLRAMLRGVVDGLLGRLDRRL